MTKYETMFVLRPDADEETYDALIERFQGIITDQGGEVTNVNRMGKSKLAYVVKKNTAKGIMCF